MKTRRILFVSHVLNLSGAPRSLFYLLKSLPRLPGWEYWVLGLRQTDLRKAFEEVVDRVEVISPKAPESLPAKALERIFSLPKIFDFLRRAEPDLVFVNSAANSRVITLARFLGYRIWVYVHEFDEGFVLFSSLRRKALLFAEKVFVTNSQQLSWVRDKVGFKGEIRILPNILPEVPDQISSPKKSFLEFRKRFPFLVATVGFLNKLKGWDYLLKLIKTLRNDKEIGFVLIGDFLNPKEKKAFYKALTEAGLHARFYLTGIVEEVWPYLRRVDCVAITSRSETFSRAAMEALACGVPVVAFKVGSLAEVFPKGYPFLIEPFAVDSFGEKILEIKNFSPEKKKAFQRTIKSHLQQFLPDRVATQFQEELKKAFGTKA